MKQTFKLKSKSWLCAGFITALAAFPFNVKAQTVPPKMWDRTIGGTFSDMLSSVQQTPDGGYILGGSTFSGIGADKSQPSRGGLDFWIVKTDAFGNKQWDKTFGGSNNDELISFQQTTDGGYILGGFSNSSISSEKSEGSKGGKDYWVIRLDSSGAQLWDKTIGGNDDDELYSLQQTSDGGFILGGWSKSLISGDKSQSTYGNHDFWIVKSMEVEINFGIKL